MRKKVKKKTRRGERIGHSKKYHDAKEVSKKKRDIAHIKCFEWEEMGHFASSYPNKLV